MTYEDVDVVLVGESTRVVEQLLLVESQLALVGDVDDAADLGILSVVGVVEPLVTVGREVDARGL